MLAPRVRAILFDFDGVLADTEALHCAAFEAVATAAGLPFARQDYYDRFLGLPDRDCLAAIHAAAGRGCSARDLDTLLTDKRAAFAHLSRTAGLYPGVAAALRRLHSDFILGVASGAWRDEIETILEREHVRTLFAAVVGADDVRAGKPAPDPFLRVLEQINAQRRERLLPADCVVIEDAPLGIVAAHSAGMRCIAVATNHHPAALANADRIIAAVSQLRPEHLMVEEGSAHGPHGF